MLVKIFHFLVLTTSLSEDDVMTVSGQSWSHSLYEDNLLGKMLVIEVRITRDSGRTQGQHVSNGLK